MSAICHKKAGWCVCGADPKADMEETKTKASHLFGWTRNKNKNTKGTVNRGENYNLNWEKQNYETWT